MSDDQLKKDLKSDKSASDRKMLAIMHLMAMSTNYLKNANGSKGNDDIIDNKKSSYADNSGLSYEREVYYQVDTLSSSPLNGAYDMNRNILLFNYREDRENGGLNLKDFNSTVTHESKHKDDFENGVMKYELNYIDSYRRLNHLEIAANLASVLSMRHEYLSDPEGFTCGNGGLETFFKEKYIKAIETGEITANSSNPEKFDEEMKFLFDGTKAVWEEKARKPHYHKVHMNSAALQYVSEDKSKVDFNSSENMDEVLNIIYNKNLGGVNFLKYLNKEDDLNLSLSEKQELNDAANYAEYTYSDEVNRDYRGGSEAWKNKSTENNYFINGEMSWMGFKRVSDPQNITIYNLAEPVIIESVSKEGDNSLQNKIMQAALLKNNER